MYGCKLAFVPLEPVDATVVVMLAEPELVVDPDLRGTPIEGSPPPPANPNVV